MSSETQKLSIEVDPMEATERIAASIEGPEKPKRKYTVSKAKLEQLKMAREKAAAAKAKIKTIAWPQPQAPSQSEPDLKSQIAEAVATALKAQAATSQPKKPKAPRETKEAQVILAPRQTAPPQSPRPSREDVLMKIIRGY